MVKSLWENMILNMILNVNLEAKFYSYIGLLATLLSNIRSVIHCILKVAFKPSTMKMGKVYFFAVVAVLLTSVVSSKHVDPETGMNYYI